MPGRLTRTYPSKDSYGRLLNIISNRHYLNTQQFNQITEQKVLKNGTIKFHFASSNFEIIQGWVSQKIIRNFLRSFLNLGGTIYNSSLGPTS
jgi:hypothetical protein